MMERLGRNDPETAKLTGIYCNLIQCRAQVNTSLGAIPEMLYCNRISVRTVLRGTPVEAYVGMKWFRSNIRLGSRLALLALAIQFLLSFGHFHGSAAQAASASAVVKGSVLPNTAGFAATHRDASNKASLANDSGTIRTKTSSGDGPNGEPTDDCAICAVIALANAMVAAAPPDVLGPQAGAFLYLPAGAELVAPNSVRAAFQPRAPPIA